MIEKFCSYIVKRMRNNMEDIDDERAEVIQYGLELIIGEIPKVILLFAIAFILKIGWLTMFAYIAILPYRACSGGFHLKTHIGCIINTSLFYYGVVLASKYIILQPIYKYILISLVLIFGIIMITLYAPADTENLPIISMKERKRKKSLSYVFLVLMLISSLFINNNSISNILIFGALVQTLFITRLVYKITNNKYGHEVYRAEEQIIS